MVRRYRRAWSGDGELERLASERLHDLGTVGELIESWVWDASFAQARTMWARLVDSIDLATSERMIPYQRLWLKVIEDRLEFGARI